MSVLLTTARGRMITGLFLVVVLFSAATARLFVWPPTDRPSPADAIVALGGDPGARRAAAAVRLAREGYAPIVVVSLGGRRARCPRPFGRVRVLCFHPDPVDTRGEAEHAAALAARHHWTRLIVVSERSQATRARMLFERCTGASLEMVPVTDSRQRLFADVAYEWGALFKALVFERSC